MLSLTGIQNNYTQVLFNEHYTFKQFVDIFENFETTMWKGCIILCISIDYEFKKLLLELLKIYQYIYIFFSLNIMCTFLSYVILGYIFCPSL